MIPLNSLNHFDFYYSYSSSAYEFETNEGVKYIITFIEYSHIMEVDFPVYSFIIDRYPGNKRSKDINSKVRNTVLVILSKFFENNQSALVAIYDSLDGRQLYRKRLFDMWYNLFNDGSINKKEGKFMSQDKEIYAVTLYSTFHKNCDEIERQFELLLKNNFYND